MEHGSRIRLVTLLCFIMAMLIPQIHYAQSCCPNGIAFYSQTAIDNFQTNYPGCTEIEGHVVITDNSTDKITNLNGLSVLTSIGEGLYVGDIDALTSLTGLNKLEFIGGCLEIFLFDSITEITAFNNLETIGGWLYIYGNRTLISLSGLDNITRIGGSMEIHGNDRLMDISALGNVTEIEGGVEIYNNDSLLSLSGLENVITIGGYLFVFNNDLLCSLTGLDNIDAESIQGLEINGNNWLSDCDVLSICNYLSNPSGNTIIVGNTAGCNSIEEVLDSCDANSVSVNESYVETRVTAYPNPFSTATTIEYELTEPTYIQLTIYNHLREVLEEAVSAYLPLGVHSYIWNAEGLSEGMYMAVLRSEDGVSVIKLIKQ